ncbi:MAG: methyltransferase domain-containing protein [Myxococcales bacterium]|nr:methyltransferase domain-containing protein [Myxococcales bacterium]
MPAPFAAVARDHGGWLIQAAAAAACELGLWDALVGGRLVQWSDQQTIAPHRREALLRVLALGGHARRAESGGWEAGTPPVPIDVPRSGWGCIADVFRSGVPLLQGPVPGDPGTDKLRRGYHDHLWEQAREPAAELAASLIGVGREGARMLDLGAGAGAWTDACLRADPVTCVTVVDCPPVLDLARDRLAGWGERVSFDAADVCTRQPGAGADIVLLAHVLHLYAPDDAAGIVALAAQAVLPGGRLVVVEMDLDDNAMGPAASVLFDLDLALHTDCGRVHCAADVAQWVRRAGLVPGHAGRLASAPEVAVVHGLRVP